MMCFKDMTFCDAKSCTHFGDKPKCFRSLTDKVKAEAEKWWGNDKYPICIFTDKPECYVPKKNYLNHKTKESIE